jgi:uncharacterized DUF497 family protein
MKRVEWDHFKDQWLISNRGFSFIDIENAIDEGGLVDVIENPNSKYSHQKIFVVLMNGYIYYVPFVENDEKIFLKTAYPSRKATKKYSKE